MYNTVVQILEQLDDFVKKAISYIPQSFWVIEENLRKTVVNSDVQLQILLVLILWLLVNISLILISWKKYEYILSDKVGSSGKQKLVSKSFVGEKNQHYKEE